MKTSFYFFLVFTLYAFTNDYDMIKTKGILPFDDHNWFVNAAQLKKVFQQNDIKVVVEIGSWLGGSTRYFAQNMPSGKVYAVDTWDGPNHRMDQSEINAYMGQSERLSRAYYQFLSNNIHTGLEKKIFPIRSSSLEASKLEIFRNKEIVPDLIYIDAAHDTESVLEDLNAWFPYVKGHGILCGDDWCWPTVRRAVEIFAQQNNLKIFAEGNFYRLIE